MVWQVLIYFFFKKHIICLIVKMCKFQMYEPHSNNISSISKQIGTFCYTNIFQERDDSLLSTTKA